MIVVKSREISAMSNRAQVTLLNSDAFPLHPSPSCVFQVDLIKSINSDRDDVNISNQAAQI